MIVSNVFYRSPFIGYWRPLHFAFALFLSFWLCSCSSIYYSFWEKLGKEKRDLLKSNVESVRGDQQDVQAHFQSALERLKDVYGTGGGRIEAVYSTVKADYERSVAKAQKLLSRINKVESIGRDLFVEWNHEIETMESEELKRMSAVKLRETEHKFERLVNQMHRSEESTRPVLVKLKDQMLYLKHNLNSQAISHLESGEIAEIERSVSELTREMQESVARANEFIGEL